MAKLSPESIRRLKQLVKDGIDVMTEIEDLRGGLKDTIEAVSEELECKPAQINKLIKAHMKGNIEEQRDSWEEFDEIWKASL